MIFFWKATALRGLRFLLESHYSERSLISTSNLNTETLLLLTLANKQMCPLLPFFSFTCSALLSLSELVWHWS